MDSLHDHRELVHGNTHDCEGRRQNVPLGADTEQTINRTNAIRDQESVYPASSTSPFRTAQITSPCIVLTFSLCWTR